MTPHGLEQRFGFLCPMRINLGLIISKPDEVRAHVLERFMANKDQEKLFFLPFNTGNGLDFHSKSIYYNFSYFDVV